MAIDHRHDSAHSRIFASNRLKGKQPRATNMLVSDYLRPAAAKAGILSSHQDEQGRLVEDDPHRFGFHNLRHSLASFLMRMRNDPKTHTNSTSPQRCQTNPVAFRPRLFSEEQLRRVFARSGGPYGGHPARRWTDA